MKTVVFLIGILLFAGSAYAGEVQCAMPYSDESVIQLLYQVNSEGKAVSRARYQFFDQNGFSITAWLDVTKSEILPHDVIRFTAGNEDGELRFEAKFDGRRDAYAGVAENASKDGTLKRVIACTLR
jgi:hypothetical protein